MKIKITLIWVSFLYIQNIYCQNVDLDKFYFNIKYQRLPKVNTKLEERTYSVIVTAKDVVKPHVDEISIKSKLQIYGWQMTDEKPTVKINLTFEDFLQLTPVVKEAKKEVKDAKGNVTMVTSGYYVECNYVTRAFSAISGPKSSKDIQLANKQNLEKEQKNSNNRFLANAKPVVKENQDSKEYIIRFNDTLKYISKEKATKKEIYDEFNFNKEALYQENLRRFTDNTLFTIKNKLNAEYGFEPTEANDFMWILESKNEEGKVQKEAIEAIKTLFRQVEANQPMAKTEEDIAPLIEYFKSIKTKYNTNNKADKKMRYAAHFNLSKIYYYLDQPEKAKQEAQLLIENDYDTKDGKRLMEAAQALLDEFNTKQIFTRHNPSK